MMMPVNDIGRVGETPEVVDDRDRGATQFLRDVSEQRAIRDWPMPALEQGQGNIANVEFRAVSAGERVVRDQDMQTAHATWVSERIVAQSEPGSSSTTLWAVRSREKR
jgi:hypothetical protein